MLLCQLLVVVLSAVKRFDARGAARVVVGARNGYGRFAGSDRTAKRIWDKWLAD